MRIANLANESPTAEGFQFAIGHLLLITAVVAAVLGLGRVVRAFGSEWENTLIVAVLPPCFVMVGLATLWAALGIGRPASRLAVVIPTALVVGAIPAFYLKVPTEDGVPYVICMGLQAIITTASLLVVRSCGWRLVWGDGVQAEPHSATQ